MDSAARCVIRDYMNGKLVYHTAPPIIDDELDGQEEEEDADMDNM